MDSAFEKLLPEIPALAERRRAGEMDDAAFAARYFLFWQIARRGRRFASRRSRGDRRPDADRWLTLLKPAEGESARALLIDWFGRYRFFGVIDNVPLVLTRWLQGAWPLILRQDIPTPREVLRMQARGVRAVSALSIWPRMLRPVLNKPDAFDFFVHDLEHACKFFHSPALHAGQRNFFAALEQAHDQDAFAPYLADAEFTRKFHYLMSDMNTHPEHSRQYLRAVLVEFYLRREEKKPATALSAEAEREIAALLRVVDDYVARRCDAVPSSGVFQPASALASAALA